MDEPAAADSVDFSTATAVTGGDRRYEAAVHPSWNGPFMPHGGILGALAMKAVVAEFASEELQPRAMTCHYLRAPGDGPVQIDVDPLRRGRRFASARATLSQGGKPCVAMLLTLSSPALIGADQWEVPAPEVAPPPARDAPLVPPSELTLESDGWLDSGRMGARYFDRARIAMRFGAPPMSGSPYDPQTGAENGCWIQLSEPRPIDHAWLAFAVDALWPTALQPLTAPALSPTLDLTTHFRRVLPPEGLPDQPLLIHNNTSAVVDGLAEQDTRVFSADGQLLAEGRQLLMLAPLEA